jgi:uridine kinase
MIKRNLVSGSKSHLSKKQLSLIAGAGQAGKTTLMLHLRDYLKKIVGKV